MDQYYVTPEDIKVQWAQLAAVLSGYADGHGGEEMTFTCLVIDGRVISWLEPVYRQREPRRSTQHDDGRLWWQVIRRLQSVVDGSCQIEVRVDLDLNGNPVSWRTPDVRKLEPAQRR